MKIIFMQMLLVGAISIGYVRAESISSNEPGKKKVQTNPVSLQAVDDAGTDLSKDATLTLSSEAPGYCSNKKFLLIDGERIDDGYQNSFAFHTRGNGNDYVIIKLFKAAVINKIYIGNRLGLEDRAKSLAIWVSIDQKEWKKIWQAETIQKEWSIKIDKKIIEARYIKIGLQEKNVLHLNKVRVFGNYKEPLTTKEKKYLQNQNKKRSVQELLIPEPGGKRPRLAPHTVVVSRTRIHYHLAKNCLHGWDDRLLFTDRSTAPLPIYGVHAINGLFTYKSFSKIASSAKAYDIDGLGIALFGNNTDRIVNSFKYIDRSGIQDFGILLDFYVPDINNIRSIIKAALTSKCAVRINGKLPITSYLAWLKPNLVWENIFKTLRSEFGDQFIFFHDGIYPDVMTLNREYLKTGKASVGAVENALNKIRSILDTFDGVYFGSMGKSAGYSKELDMGFYRDIFLPLFNRVLSEQEYKNKYFALSAVVGHHNSGAGVCSIREYGTKFFRQSMELSISADPDLIFIAEWDELNENTCLGPTVCNSFALQRIMKYYVAGLKGQKPAPNPGDNTSIPNIVLSYRKIIAFGEELKFEVLNIPDSEKNETYTVQLSLKGSNGTVIRKFPVKTFSSGRLYDETFTLATEDLCKNDIVIPSLTIVNPHGDRYIFEDGLQYVQARTWNWDLKNVKQPLRDIIQPKVAEFAAVPGNPGPENSRMIKVAFESTEDLAYAEILEDDDEVYSLDPKNEFKREPDYVQLKLNFSKAGGGLPINGKIIIQNSNFYISPAKLSGYYNYSGGQAIDYNGTVGHYKRDVLISLPRKSAAQAVLTFNFDAFNTQISVKKIIEDRIYSEAYANGVTLTVERYTRLYRVPFHLNQKKNNFYAQIFPERENAQYNLRVISKSGKIYRTKPLVLKPGRNKTEIKMPIFSDAKNEVIVCDVPAYMVPEITYDFTPRYGTIFHTKAGRIFYGQLGGFWDVSCGREHFIPYGDPFQTYQFKNYPKNINDKAPKWVVENGVSCLKFDGKGNFIALPREVIPARGAYTLTFDVKILSDKPQVIFCHQSGISKGSLVLIINNGKLNGQYFSQSGIKLFPSLPIAINKWTKIQVVNNLKEVKIKINDKKSSKIPYPGPAAGRTCSVFGGWGNGTEWFDGYLKSFSIRHTSEEKEK